MKSTYKLVKHFLNFSYMPLTNYPTAVPANRSIAEIQDALVKHGATGILSKYEQGTGRIEALPFLLQPQVFLPFATDAKGQTLYEQVLDGTFLLGPGEETESPGA